MGETALGLVKIWVILLHLGVAESEMILGPHERSIRLPMWLKITLIPHLNPDQNISTLRIRAHSLLLAPTLITHKLIIRRDIITQIVIAITLSLLILTLSILSKIIVADLMRNIQSCIEIGVIKGVSISSDRVSIEIIYGALQSCIDFGCFSLRVKLFLFCESGKI